jgi:hypothetical protein
MPRRRSDDIIAGREAPGDARSGREQHGECGLKCAIGSRGGMFGARAKA